jgi:HEAT repeat protein
MSEAHEITLIKLIGYELSGINLSLDESSFLKIRYPEVFSELKHNKEFLLEVLISIFNEDDEQLMKSSLIILDILGEEINVKLIGLLDDNDFIIKTNAIKIIGKLKVNNAVNSLIRNLDNMYSEISMASIEALGEIGHTAAIPELLSILDIKALNYEYIDYDMKWSILKTLIKIYTTNENASFEYLFNILNTDNEFLKENIAFIMGEIANELFIDSLFSLIQERNLDVRKNSIIALGKIGSVRAIDPLMAVLNASDTYWLLKKVTIDALFNIYRKNRHLIKSEDFNKRRIFVINTERMIDYLKTHEGDNFKIKVSMIKFLEVHGEKTALPALIKQISDFHGIVRISATKAIKKIEKRLELEDEIKK